MLPTQTILAASGHQPFKMQDPGKPWKQQLESLHLLGEETVAPREK